MKRMIPSSKLTIKNDKLTALEGIYDSEGNQIIADGGSLVVGNPEGTATATLSKISIQNDGEPVVYEVEKGLPNPISENVNIAMQNGGASSYKVAFSTYAGIDVQTDISSGDKFLQISGGSWIKMPVGVNGKVETSGTFEAPKFKRTSIETFTPATAGTITKEQADEYVKKICSGQLAYSSDYPDAPLKLTKYFPSASIEGQAYLQLQYVPVFRNTDTGDILVGGLYEIDYLLNSSGSLNINVIDE